MLLMFLLRVRQVSGMLRDKREMVQVPISGGGRHLHPFKKDLNFSLDRLIIMAVIDGLYCLGQMATNVRVSLILSYFCG